MLCRPSTSRDWLLVLSEQLLDDDLRKRPMMSMYSRTACRCALAWKAITTQPNGLTQNFHRKTSAFLGDDRWNFSDGPSIMYYPTRIRLQSLIGVVLIVTDPASAPTVNCSAYLVCLAVPTLHEESSPVCV